MMQIRKIDEEKEEGRESRSAGNQMRNDKRMNDHKYENLDRPDIGVIIFDS